MLDEAVRVIDLANAYYPQHVGVGDINAGWEKSIYFIETLGMNNGSQADSNGDNVFNSSDLIVAFQANEYEDTLDGNSTFQEGDWNGDGDFDSSDLVFAFAEAEYEPPDPVAPSPQTFGFR